MQAAREEAARATEAAREEAARAVEAARDALATCEGGGQPNATVEDRNNELASIQQGTQTITFAHFKDPRLNGAYTRSGADDAVKALAALGAGGRRPANLERDLHRFTGRYLPAIKGVEPYYVPCRCYAMDGYTEDTELVNR